MSSLTLKNIYKKYAGGVVAVSDFCLDIKDKEFIPSKSARRLGERRTFISATKSIPLSSSELSDRESTCRRE